MMLDSGFLKLEELNQTEKEHFCEPKDQGDSYESFATELWQSEANSCSWICLPPATNREKIAQVVVSI